uniref:Uncharacterized protein n=1 Tax=Triticum urartu TaxID=4572 RepID=A0A8R7P9H5_TRIUA
MEGSLELNLSSNIMSKPGIGRKEGLRAVDMGTWRKEKKGHPFRNRGCDLFRIFPMPPMTIVLRCSFLFLSTCRFFFQNAQYLFLRQKKIFNHMLR